MAKGSPGQYYYFEAVQGEALAPLVVLAGEEGLTASDGYGGWEVTDRPFRTSLTWWKGNRPFTLSVPILFDNWDDGGSVEEDIALLERFAGRGINAISPPPALRLYSGSEYYQNDSGLVPLNYRSAPPNPGPPTWVIQDIDWGSALRNNAGNRVRQEATVSLLQVIGLDKITFGSKSAAKRTPPNQISGEAEMYTVRQGDTLKSIARKKLGNADRWNEIKKLNNLKSSTIKAGQTLVIPVR